MVEREIGIMELHILREGMNVLGTIKKIKNRKYILKFSYFAF